MPRFGYVADVRDLDVERAERVLAKRPTSIIMVTERDVDGISYEVVARGGGCGLGDAAFELGEADDVVWSREVSFGADAMHRSGGLAFVEAARAQERVSAVLCGALGWAG